MRIILIFALHCPDPQKAIYGRPKTLKQCRGKIPVRSNPMEEGTNGLDREAQGEEGREVHGLSRYTIKRGNWLKNQATDREAVEVAHV